MKIYNNPSLLQKIIIDNSTNEFEHLFSSNVILKFKTDEDDNLILENLEGGTICLDSTIAYQLSDYYKSVGDALKRLENITEQPPATEYKNSKGLGILFHNDFILFVNKEFKLQRNAKEGTCYNCSDCNM